MLEQTLHYESFCFIFSFHIKESSTLVNNGWLTTVFDYEPFIFVVSLALCIK